MGEKEQAEARGQQLSSDLVTIKSTIELLEPRQVPLCPICVEEVCDRVTQGMNCANLVFTSGTRAWKWPPNFAVAASGGMGEI